MEGYTRPPATTHEVMQALREAMEAHPTERLGQILVNALGHGGDLFNLWDEELVRQLRAYTIRHAGAA